MTGVRRLFPDEVALIVRERDALQEKLSRIETHCNKTLSVYRGGMDASALAEDIIEIVKEGNK